jgi:MFS family permease
MDTRLFTFRSLPLGEAATEYQASRNRKMAAGVPFRGFWKHTRMRTQPTETRTELPKRSLAGLNAANFFQAEMVGVVVPVLNALLRESHWRYDAIGMATAAAGLGTLVFQTPAGWLTDRFSCRRILFAAMAILTGVCLAAIPIVPRTYAWMDSLLFVSGAAQSFFTPLLGALALGLAGHKLLNRTMGANQGWNHAGNIFAALLAMGVVSALGLNALFYCVGACSLLAAGSMLLIRPGDLNERIATGLTNDQNAPAKWTDLFRDRTILFLFLSIFAFHLANAPILPMVALYVKRLHGSDDLMTATVLTAQVVMVPVALLAGKLCDSWGRKPVMAVAFWVLPLRIFSYSLVRTPSAVVYLQALDGIGAGIYGVAVVALAADLTRGKGRFNTLMGVFATALAIGGVAGPLLSGFLIQRLGFHITFYAFAVLAALGAMVFTLLVPETSPEKQRTPDAAVRNATSPTPI